MKPIFRFNNINNSPAQKDVTTSQIHSKTSFLFSNPSEIRCYTSHRDKLHQLEIIRNLKSKKGVFFDANGVLYYRRANKIVSLQNFLVSKGFDSSKFPTEEELDHRVKDLKLKAGKGEASKELFYTELFLLHHVTDPSLLKEGVEEMKRSVARIIVSNGVQRALSTLHFKGFKLGVITNSMSSRLEKLEWLKNVGIHTEWDGFVSSKDVGVKKPHPDIYLRCLEEANVRPEDAIFVGHSKDELIGAKKLGITTCMVNPDPDAEADYNLQHDLSNILSYI